MSAGGDDGDFVVSDTREIRGGCCFRFRARTLFSSSSWSFSTLFCVAFFHVGTLVLDAQLSGPLTLIGVAVLPGLACHLNQDDPSKGLLVDCTVSLGHSTQHTPGPFQVALMHTVPASSLMGIRC